MPALRLLLQREDGFLYEGSMPLTPAERAVFEQLLFRWENTQPFAAMLESMDLDPALYGPIIQQAKSQYQECATDLRYALSQLPLVEMKRRVNRIMKKL